MYHKRNEHILYIIQWIREYMCQQFIAHHTLETVTKCNARGGIIVPSGDTI